jgi:hypothetical protein
MNAVPKVCWGFETRRRQQVLGSIFLSKRKVIGRWPLVGRKSARAEFSYQPALRIYSIHNVLIEEHKRD